MQALRSLTPNQLKELDDYIRDSRRMGPRDVVTHEMRVENQNKIIYQTDQPRTVTPQELDARAKMQRNMDAQRDQLEAMERERAWKALTPEQQQAKENREVAQMGVELAESQYQQALSRRQMGRVEVLELRLEQRREALAAAERELEIVNARAESAKQLADDPSLSFARLSAGIEVDRSEPGSDERVRASIYLNALNNVTDPTEAKSLVREYHQWEAQQLANRRTALLEAEHAAIVEANPAVQRAHELGKQAAEAGLAELEARKRAEGGQE